MCDRRSRPARRLLIAQFRAFLCCKAGDLVLGQRADTPASDKGLLLL
jgi:hypothetical protein